MYYTLKILKIELENFVKNLNYNLRKFKQYYKRWWSCGGGC